MTKLLYVLNDAGFFISHRLPIALAAQEAGYDVHLACPDAPALQALRDLPITIHNIPLSRRGANPFSELATLGALVQLYRRVQPTLVHNVTVKPVVYGSIAARVANVPAVVNAVSGLGFVFIARGTGARVRRAVVRMGYRFAFSHPRLATIFQNPDDLEAFTTRGLLSPDQTVLIRGSGVDLRKFVPQPEPVAPVVMMPSRMLWDKGVGEFVEAARLLKERGVDAKFVLVGETDIGNPTAIPVEQLEAWSREGVVEWWGRREDMPETIAKATLVCLPSYREGLPKVLLEVAAVGRAIITTDVPGCRHVVTHGENGLLVPARDATALAEAINYLLSNAVMRRAMATRNRALAEAEFSIERVVAETLSLYDRLSSEVREAAVA